MTHLWRGRSLLHKCAGHVFVQTEEVQFLLVMATQGRSGLLACNRKNGHAIEPRIIQSRNQVRGARPGGCNTNAQLPRELGVRGSHERCHLLVTGLHELDLALRAVERAEDSVDAIARISKHHTHTPRMEACDQEVTHGLSHLFSSRFGRDPLRPATRYPRGRPQVPGLRYE